MADRLETNQKIQNANPSFICNQHSVLVMSIEKGSSYGAFFANYFNAEPNEFRSITQVLIVSRFLLT